MTAADAVTQSPRVAAPRSPSSIVIGKLFRRRVVLLGAVILAIDLLYLAVDPRVTY